MPNISQFKNHEEYLDWYREYRKKHAEYFREYNRKYNKKYRKKNGYSNEENSKKKYPEKEKARRILRLNVKKGYVKKKRCEVCDSETTQAHHEDYTKPLTVNWLCPLHHKDKHRKIFDKNVIHRCNK